jgi:F-box protein 20
MHNSVVMAHFSLPRESRGSTVTSWRRTYSSDDILDDGVLPPTVTLSETSYQSERLEDEARAHPAEMPKEDSTTFANREDSVVAETQLASHSPEEQRLAPSPSEEPRQASGSSAEPHQAPLLSTEPRRTPLPSEEPHQASLSSTLQRPSSLSSQQSWSTRAESTRISASLPRSYQRTDTARLTSVVTARPFGTSSRGISSLPRSYTVKMP